ncbi:hypothetical protein THRCLA_20343 [Thraustotheca clavata]|uniref:RING-type domain-containing protein n=1 Tax=Thraustotheca clavata TaxID=74557 RepID=A0A1W0A8T3_9STRA|nr:hypothetical protein THRCLA_20343 [Thraustotheca clavata]
MPFPYESVCVDDVQRLEDASKDTPVKVFSSAMNVVSETSGPFIIYNLIVSCPLTKTWWVLRKRYSEFLTFHRAFATVAKRYAACPEVNDVISIPKSIMFPKKQPLKPIQNAAKVQERTQRFQQYTAMLVTLRQDCVFRALQLPPGQSKEGLIAIYDLVQDFLNIPETCRQHEIRQTIALVSPEGDHANGSMERPEDPCTICLCEFSENFNKVVFELPCKHTFHQDCIVQWLDKSTQCPLCRQNATEESISQLKEAHENDMKQVKVHSSAKNVAFQGTGRFTIYTMIVTCPGTKTWWILKKRYSQFFSIRKKLLSMFKTCTNSFPQLAEILSDALTMEFPKKHILVSVDNKQIIKERKTQLQRFTATLIAIRASCVLASLNDNVNDKQLEKLDFVFDLLQDFLEIPTSQESPNDCDDNEDCTLSSRSTEGCESCSICLNDFKTSNTTYHYQTPKHNATSVRKVRFALEDEDDQAPNAEEKVLKLPCNHFFHEECVMYWIEQKSSCPLCRAEAFDESIEKLRLVQEEEMDLVHVRSSAQNVSFHGNSPFVIYTFVVTCPGTKTWWILKKRYSQFFSLRKKLVEIEKSIEKELIHALHIAIAMPFPPKYYFARVNDKSIISERKTQLKHFVAALVALRATCLLTLLAHPANNDTIAPCDQLYCLLQDFLEIPNNLEEHELRHTIAIVSPDVAAAYMYPEDPIQDSCSICLSSLNQIANNEEFEVKKVRFSNVDTELDCVLKLPCGHCFHSECVLGWVEQKNSCPLCRTNADHGSCKPFHRVKLAQESDMNQVKVHSSAMWYAPRGITPFTIYTLIVSCPGTKAWWVLQKRYSQFYRLRKQLLQVARTCVFSAKPVRELLKDILHCEFPNRHLSFDTTAIVNERKTLLKEFTSKIIALRAACVLLSLKDTDAGLSTKLEQVYNLVQRFLEIPDNVRGDDLRHTVSEGSLACTPEVGSPSCDENDEETCAICMSEFDSTESALKMACNHTFHEDCIVHWFEEKLTCPLCRDEAIGGHVL